MQVILLERVAKLGQMGEVVRVKDGYARNFLLPRGKALRATEANKKHFDGQRAQLEARNLERKGEAQAVAEKLNGQVFVILRQAGKSGQLYGSVSTRDIAEAATAGGFSVERHQIVLHTPIKSLGLHKTPVHLHPEVDVEIIVNVARSAEEAERQAKGKSATVREETTMADLGLEVGAALAEAGGDMATADFLSFDTDERPGSSRPFYFRLRPAAPFRCAAVKRFRPSRHISPLLWITWTTARRLNNSFNLLPGGRATTFQRAATCECVVRRVFPY